ncbi:MAG: hypothetical protein KUG73_02520 [Pseudomonadales bacterium]|nr:hypothetical protein [Pseudomonadales bacterium]
MTIENVEEVEAEIEEGLSAYIDLLLQNVKSPVKRAYAKQLLLNDFNATLPRGIYMDNDMFLDFEVGAENAESEA